MMLDIYEVLCMNNFLQHSLSAFYLMHFAITFISHPMHTQHFFLGFKIINRKIMFGVGYQLINPIPVLPVRRMLHG